MVVSCEAWFVYFAGLRGSNSQEHIFYEVGLKRGEGKESSVYWASLT
jgi:hypothetical protein